MSDDGQKYLPISDAMGRDIDSGKAASRDIADFMPDDVAQEMYDASRPGPVHAENLIPISPAEGAAMRTIDPESGRLPMFPATRRVIPAPFRRDRVTGGSHGKAWCLVTAEQVRPGDIITDMGLILDVRESVSHDTASMATAAHIHSGDGTVEGCPGCFAVATGTEYTVTGSGGHEVTWPAGREVKVFRSRNSQ